MGIILVYSENLDESTNEVIDWLCHYDARIIRINAGNHLNITLYDSITNVFHCEVNGISFCSTEVKAVWYRKGEMYYPFSLELEHKELGRIMDSYIEGEWRGLFEFFIEELKQIRSLGSYSSRIFNKLNTLQLARKVGFSVPHTFIASSKKTVVQKLKTYDKLIVKGITDTPNINTQHIAVSAYTERVDNDSLEKLPNVFLPSLFQEEIEKSYEVRSFMLKDKFYSMAIFSQENPKTITDFRKYDAANPNRTVPFQLDEATEEKCRKLAQALDLDTGSFDFIVSSLGQVIFLEINPVGQFMMVSKPCNYPIEKEIADYLIE